MRKIHNILQIQKDTLDHLPSEETLLIHLPLDEPSTSTIVKDYSGNAKNLSYNGGAVTAGSPGIVGRSILLGLDSYLETTAAGPLVGGTTSFSVSFWFKCTTVIAANRIMAMESLGVLTANAGWFIGLQATTGYLYIGLSDGTNYSITTYGTTNWADNSWHHVIVIFDRTEDYITAFVDATFIQETSIVAVTGNTQTGGYLRLGQNSYNLTEDFVGYIDEFRIYQMAFTDREIIGLYRQRTNTKVQTCERITNLYVDNAITSTTLDANTSISINSQSSATLTYVADVASAGSFGSNGPGIKCYGDFVAGRVLNSIYSDYADAILCDKDYSNEPGVVLAIDKNGTIKKSWKHGQSVIGISSSNFAFCAGYEKGKTPIAVAGQVKIKVSIKDFGKLKPSDKLVADKNGYARKKKLFGKVIATVLSIGDSSNHYFYVTGWISK